MLPGLFVAALFATLIWRQPEAPRQAEEWVLSGPTMGTTYTVKLAASAAESEPPAGLEALIGDALDAVNGAMSTYLEDSEISRFNRYGAEPFAASQELLEVLAEAQRISELSGGAFDVTVGPLVDAWGFGPAAATADPDDGTIEALLGATGFRRLLVDRDTGLLRKELPQLRIDLSAIAKGYAVDRVAAALEAAGRRDLMVEIGGEVRARGHNGRGRVWRIGIERPRDEGRALHTSIPLADRSLATSGDYRNFYLRDGVRLSHTIDPRTGRPVSHGLASVSVVHLSCMTADGLATAFEVLGPTDGPPLAERLDVAALFLVREENGGFREIVSPAWTALFEMAQPAPAVAQ